MQNPFECIEERLVNIEALLVKLSLTNENQGSSPEKDEIMTVQDAAKFLSLSVPTIYALMGKGELPFMKRSKRCYFSKVELFKYLNAGRKMTNSELEVTAKRHITKAR